MNKGVVLIVVGVVLIIASIGVIIADTAVALTDFEVADNDNFVYNGQYHFYTFTNVGPGSIEVQIDSSSRDLKTAEVTDDDDELLREEEGNQMTFVVQIKEKGDYTVTIYGASEDDDITATYTGEYFIYICFGGCLLSIVLGFVGLVLIIIGIAMIVKSMSKKRKKRAPPPRPPAHIHHHYPPQRPQTWGTRPDVNPYYYPPPGQYPHYPPPQGRQHGYGPPPKRRRKPPKKKQKGHDTVMVDIPKQEKTSKKKETPRTPKKEHKTADGKEVVFPWEEQS